MDRSGQQLGCSIIEPVANENKRGYREMYKNKSACLCVAIENKDNEFGAISECNGMCAKPNINIYIENYGTTTNEGKYEMKGETKTFASYPYYNALKSESNNSLYISRNSPTNNSIYSETYWEETSKKKSNVSNWEPPRNTTNTTFYPYINNGRQYITEKNSYVRNQIDTKSSINHVQLNISSGVEKAILYNEFNRNFKYRGEIARSKDFLNAVSDKSLSVIDSGSAPSTYRNLYVAPPYFTVDNFVSEEQRDTRRKTKGIQLHNRNLYIEKLPNLTDDISVQEDSSIVSNKQHVGIKLVERSQLLDSDSSEQLHLPIKIENSSYEKHYKSEKIYDCGREKSMHPDVAYSSIMRNDFMQNKNYPPPISEHQYNCADSIILENQSLYREAELRREYNTAESGPHNIAIHDLQCTQYQKHCKRETCSKKMFSNMLLSSAKNITRDLRKPNYRELINHVHALRTATSEDDLNMQIIKRTLNFNSQSKYGANPITPRKMSIKTVRKNEFTKCSRMQNYNDFNPVSDKGFPIVSTDVTSPLDLSVKTIKTIADSTDNNLKRKVLLTENAYPPKFNFRPNFSENLSMENNTNSVTAKISEQNTNVINVNLAPSQNLEDPVNMISQSSDSMHNESTFNRSAFCNRLDNGCSITTSTPKICKLQNSQIEGTCTKQERNHSKGIKLEVKLKRKSSLDQDREHELLDKKNCVRSFYHPDFNDSSFNKYSKAQSIDLKAASNIVLFDSILNDKDDEYITSVKNKATINQNQSKNEPTIVELRSNFIGVKQDVSSIIAARIRTKAELKGFTFQEDKDIYDQKPFSNKENCQCNYDTPSKVQIHEVELSDWKNACNSFVDQLNNYKKLRSESNDLTLCEPATLQKINSINTKDDHKNASEDKNMNEFRGVYIKAVSDSFPTSILTSFDVYTDNNIPIKNCMELEDSKHLVIKCEQQSNSFSDKNTAKHVSSNINNIADAKDLIKKSKIYRNKLVPRSQNIEQKQMVNNLRMVNLTKISVVRLKREKYASARYAASGSKIDLNNDSNQEQIYNTKNSATKRKHLYNVGRSFPSITKSTLRRKKLYSECIRTKQQNLDLAVGNSDSKINTITTRLRLRRQQIHNETEIKEKNKDDSVQHYKKQNECEISNDPDKIYLEVYRYKRSLKVPPNLITIRNPYAQRMSASLPDLDISLHNTLIKTAALNVNSYNKVDNNPKSIIDVLHSRVVNPKCQAKNIQKQIKIEHQDTPKLTIPRGENSQRHLEPFKSYDNIDQSYREHRNVFKTQILTSRTRMEYKTQLNKEIIREIFGGSERPASAPPEINIVKSDIGKEINKSFQQCTDSKIKSEHGKNGSLENVCNSNYAINGISKTATEDGGQCIINKCIRKRNGRSYRRRFSSGFDYLRKRKKSKAHTLYNYSHMKTRVQNYLTETNCNLKSENDVSREIQRWVLNKGVGQSALHKAARLGYIDVIVYCLERMGLNPDHKDNAGYTALHDACVNGRLEIARVLLQYGANHSEGAHSGIRPLHEACENGHIEIVRMLLSYGADPLLETYSGQTPLMLASDPEVTDFIKMHLVDVQAKEIRNNSWSFSGPWKLFDDTESGYDAFAEVSSLQSLLQYDSKTNFAKPNYLCGSLHFIQNKKNKIICDINSTKQLKRQGRALKNDVCDYEIIIDTTDAEGELFEFEESNMPLPPLYLLKDEGMEKWVLLSDLCSLLKVKSKDTLLNKIYPSICPATVTRAFTRELKMCDFLEKATCLQLLCAGEKINICHSKVVLVQYNENVRKLLGVKTIFMKF